VSDFKHQQPVLQCYKCQSFGHVAAACKSAEKCRKCGHEHNSKECTAENPMCANCDGNHSASDFACPIYAKEMTKHETSQLSYASAVKRGGDKVDCIRLACSVATSMVTILSYRLGLKLNASDACKDVAESVARFYKVNIGGAHVHDIAYLAKKI
jgi:hypothetical protein